MVKAVGIDSGTKSMDIFGFDDETGEIIIDASVDRNRVTENPGIIIELLREVQDEYGKIDAIVGPPCGYGIPLKPAREATDAEIALATFITEADVRRRLKIVGLRELMLMMREAEDLNIYFTPGVIHLPTVPEWRKANRIDLGTADKVFTAALAIVREAERRGGVPYSETNLIAVEIASPTLLPWQLRTARSLTAWRAPLDSPVTLGWGGSWTASWPMPWRMPWRTSGRWCFSRVGGRPTWLE